MKNKILLAIILMVYTLLPILILLNKYLFTIKFYLLTIVGLLIYILMKLFGVSNKKLGICKKNTMKSIRRNLILIIISIVIIIIFKILHIDKYNPDETILFYLFYFYNNQEFLYRGVFGYFESEFNNKNLWLLLSSFCYSFVHIIYKDTLTCVLTFIVGIIWYLLYKKDNNLAGVSLSHMVLGILAIALGIIN